jgi:hypothetical protein
MAEKSQQLQSTPFNTNALKDVGNLIWSFAQNALNIGKPSPLMEAAKTGQPADVSGLSSFLGIAGALKPTFLKESQAITSARTSVNTIPRSFKKVQWEPGKVNLDLGGGKYDTATDFLSKKGVKNLVYDPYNRSLEHNLSVKDFVLKNKVDTVTINNVLNVIREPESRSLVIRNAALSLKPEGTAYFQVYAGDKTRIGKETTKGWQENKGIKDYMDEIRAYFKEVKSMSSMIVARIPRTGK